MVRRVCIALLVTTVVAQTAMAQSQGTTGRGTFVGWLKNKVTGTGAPRAAAQQSQQGYLQQQQQAWAAQQYRAQMAQRAAAARPTSAAEVQRAVAAATGNQPNQYQQVAAQQQAAQQQQAVQHAAQQRAAQQKAQYAAAQRAQYAAAQQQRAAQYAAQQRAQQARTQQQRPQMSPQQMQQYQAQMQRARQYQAAQQNQFRFASQSRQVPARTAPMTRLSPTPASARRPYAPPVRQASMSQIMAQVSGGSVMPGGSNSIGQYPTTSAGLYSSPQPNIPYQVGMTAITNQALYPHEFLYPHEYRAIYPPYYYKVKGGWLSTPFGVWSNETWKPMGTEVNVKYKSRISPFSGFIPPLNR